MNKNKIVLCALLLLTVSLIFSGCGITLDAVNGSSQVKITIRDGKGVVTELPNKTEVTQITIPDVYEGVPVTEIADFAGCNLESAQKIIIGKNIEKIGVWAFENNQSLEEFSVSEDNAYFRDVDGVLYNKEVTELLFYPLAKGAQEVSVTSDDGKTETAKRISYTIPEGVTKIRTKAFYKCENLYSLTLPSTLREIEEKAFFKCVSLNNIQIPQGTEYIGKDAFSYCEALTEITIPTTVKEIGDYAFYNCTKLLTLNMECAKSNVSFGEKWQPTNNGMELRELKINWKNS